MEGRLLHLVLKDMPPALRICTTIGQTNSKPNVLFLGSGHYLWQGVGAGKRRGRKIPVQAVGEGGGAKFQISTTPLS